MLARNRARATVRLSGGQAVASCRVDGQVPDETLAGNRTPPANLRHPAGAADDDPVGVTANVPANTLDSKSPMGS